MSLNLILGEGNGIPLQYSCLENPMDGGAWWAAVHGVAQSPTRLHDFTFTLHFHALEKEMATHSSVLAWRIPGTGEPGGLPSMGSHRVGHDWNDLAAATANLILFSSYTCTWEQDYLVQSSYIRFGSYMTLCANNPTQSHHAVWAPSRSSHCLQDKIPLLSHLAFQAIYTVFQANVFLPYSPVFYVESIFQPAQVSYCLQEV